MKLEIKGLTKRFGSFTANDKIDLTVEPGEIHCLLGENGAGKSTLMNMLYGLLDPTEGEILLDGKPVTFASPGRRDGVRHRHGAPALHADPRLLRRRERHAGPRADPRRRRPQPARRLAAGARALRPLQAGGRPGRAGRGHPGRRPAAGRDHQGARQRGPGADPRRAHRGAHAAGDRRADGDHARPQGARHLDHLHHPQAARGQGDRRPDQRDPPRQGRRHRAADRLRGRARRDDGRPLGQAAGRQAARRASASRCSRRAASASSTPAASPSYATSASRRGPARCSPSPASRATARPS